VRRWLLVLGKVAAYFTLASALCLTSVWVTYLLMTLAIFGPGVTMTELFAQGRFVILLRESLVLVFGLLTYGGIAMVMASLFKSSGYIPLLLGWEVGLPYLPTALKSWTVMYYLQSLLPGHPMETTGLFALLGEPAPIWLCIVVLTAVPAFFIAVCAFLFQRRECLYAGT
jgi:hypothetical protein